MEETVKKPQYIIRRKKKRKEKREKRLKRKKTKEKREKRLKRKEIKKKRKHKELSTLKSQHKGMFNDTFCTDICV